MGADAICRVEEIGVRETDFSHVVVVGLQQATVTNIPIAVANIWRTRAVNNVIDRSEVFAHSWLEVFLVGVAFSLVIHDGVWKG